MQGTSKLAPITKGEITKVIKGLSSGKLRGPMASLTADELFPLLLLVYAEVLPGGPNLV